MKEHDKSIPDSFWEQFYIPDGVDPSKHVANTCPAKEEFDYVLSTDGSGHADGCGAYAAVIERTFDGDNDLAFGSNFGSTVQRNEMQGMLQGLYFILRKEIAFREERGWYEEGITEPIAKIRSYRPIRVLWYTDRHNIANAMLRDQDGKMLNKRSSEKDLWASFRWLSSAFLITPYYIPRNDEADQELSDALCTLGRDSMKQLKTLIAEKTWLQPKDKLPQKALF